MLDADVAPVVHVLTTGGTIDKEYFDAKSAYHVGAPQIVSILHEANIQVTYRLETLFQKDSLDLTDEDRAAIAERVRAVPSRRVLITHGTDTMVHTAQALYPVGDKTVVLVGSLTPARFKGTDAVFNIGFAWSAVQTLPCGVYVAMNGQVFSPDHVRKNRAANRFEEM
ncbi:MAG: asparaginase domain-containing protein [Bacteroidota bacterium]